MTLKEFDFEKEPIVSIVKKILTDSVKMKASDIHFDPQVNDLSIKFRINGNLTEYTVAPDSVKINILTRIKILANMNITESLLPQIGAISFDVEGQVTNMRVSSLPVANGEKIVVHISNYAKNLKSLSKIGINPDDVSEIRKMLKEQQGIILITGNAASGKSTTMYSILKEINSKSINIISIEDPIKMKLDGINQVQIAPEKGLTYRNIIRNVLLQDPNVICINELVDDETTRGALRASITGRLVLSTMHTKSAFKTIETLLNMDVENYLLGSNLIGIISQRLVKKLCPNCRELKKATEYEKTVIKKITGQDIKEIYYPKGCTECQGGYIEQIPVVEVVTIDEELRNAISNNKSKEIIRNIINKNNNSILYDGFQKVINGDTSFDEIIRITDVKIDFTKEQEDIKEYILGNGETTEEEPKEIKKPIEEKEEEKDEEPKYVTTDNVETKEDIKEQKDNDNKNNENDKEIDNNIDKEEDSTSEEKYEKSEEENESSEKETEKERKTVEDVGLLKILSNLEKENTEKVEEKKKKEDTPKTKFNADDDDDDDDEDFNYGDSYSIF